MSDLTAAEVVSAAAPVAGALGITVELTTLLDDGSQAVVIFDAATEYGPVLSPDNAARLLVGMVAEKSECFSGDGCSFTSWVLQGDGYIKRGREVQPMEPRGLRTLFLATMRAFARAKGVENV